MANTITFVKRSELPAPIKGKVGVSQVTVAGNGQVIISSVAMKNLAGVDKLVMAFAGMKAYLFLPDAPVVIKQKVEAKDMIELKFPKKGGIGTFSGTVIFKSMLKYGASEQYDYTASGNQSFPAEYDEKQKALTFELETGLTPKPVVARKKKTAPAPTVVKAAEKTVDAGTLDLDELDVA